MLLCWKRSPDDRPSFNELHLALREILQEKEVTERLIYQFNGWRFGADLRVLK